MCGICGVRLLHEDLSDGSKERIVSALGTLGGIDANVLAENNALAAGIAYYFNIELNHRGDASSGIYTFNGSHHHFHGGMGVAREVFNLDDLVSLPGFVATGHDRYATTGIPRPQNIQPLVAQLNGAVISLGHNGNITNEGELREMIIGEEKRLQELGLSLKSTTDSELLLHSIALELYKHPDKPLPDIIGNAMQPVRGAYSIVGTIDDKLIGFRDPHGIKPLVFGQLGDDIAVFASEGHTIRDFAEAAGYDAEIRPVGNGELIVVDSNGVSEHRYTPPKKKLFCSFEWAYLQSPKEEDAARLRQTLGRRLWKKSGVDIRSGGEYSVVPIPRSGIIYAFGFSKDSGIPYQNQIKISESYIRSFMGATQEERQSGVRNKHKFEDSYIGKAMFLTDDSIVRSNTMSYIVRELRDRNVEELHVMVGTPQIVNPCWLGVQIPNTDELIAADLTGKQVERYFESIFYGAEYEIDELKGLVGGGNSVQSIVDQSISEGKNRYLNNLNMTEVVEGKFSLTYLTLKDFKGAFDEIGINSNDICTACMQKNGSGYTPAMKRDLQVAGVI